MLIVLEGADGTGKSTLAADLADRLNAKLLHFGPPEDHPLAEYQLTLDSYRREHVVVDRLHWSQEIYGPLHRGECQLAKEGMRHMDLYLRSRGALMVHLTDWPSRVRERMLSRGDQGLGDPPPEDLQHLVAAYWRMAETTTLPTMTIRSEDLFAAPVDTAERILLEAHLLALQVEPLAAHPSYVGGLDPDVLLVGDTVEGSNRRSRRHLAAFTPYPACSGAYLLRTLEEEVAQNVGLVNAADEADLPLLWEKLSRPPIVALGRNATEMLEARGVHGFGVAPHPQYMRRFHHRRPEVYRRLLAAAVLGERRTSWPTDDDKDAL